MIPDADVSQFDRLLTGRHPCIIIVTPEEAHALSIVREAVMRTPQFCRTWKISGGLRDGLVAEHPPIPDTEHPAAALYYLLRMRETSVDIFLDLSPHLNDARTLRLLRDLIEQRSNHGGQIVLIDHEDKFPEIIRRESTPFEVRLPDDEEINRLVRTTLRRIHSDKPIKAEISADDFQLILRHLGGLTRRQIERIIIEAVADDATFDITDLAIVAQRKRQMISGAGLLEFVSAPATLDEIGGMDRLKSWLRKRENTFSTQARAFGLAAPRGILLLGVQGAGKSYCAKAIATAWKRPLLRMDVGALYDRYIGESERRLRDALHQSERMAPVVLWIDEVEKAFASAASRSTDGGLSQRMFGALLTWMQEHAAPVFLVATANDIEALPPELLRKGRFDEIFFVDLPEATAREEIFRIHLRKRERDVTRFDIPRLAAAAEGYTGAEIEQAIVSAMHEVFGSGQEITTEAIQHAIEESPPLAVTQEEKITALRHWARGRCVPVQ
ncbi:MAG: AAA family ATPase [Phycisphaerales bacterium]|nr:AAA family ATPase [Phycisphaerales bacterium]